MARETASSATARRNRIIAIAAGAITVIAIVLAFASEYLELSWKWIRPATELLLLGELVGLIVLERHQLFEPVSEKVADIDLRIAEIQATLGLMKELMNTSGQVSVAIGARESVQLRTRLLREALMREQQGPQILRNARLSGLLPAQDTREVRDEWRALNEALSQFLLLPGSSGDSRGHRWLSRSIWTFASVYALKSGLEFIRNLPGASEALNVEIKVQLRPRPEAVVSPSQITDRDVFLSYDDETTPFRWGLALQGPQYVALFARWFDDRWAAISDTYVIYSRNGLNEKAVDRIRKELEAAEATGEQKTA